MNRKTINIIAPKLIFIAFAMLLFSCAVQEQLYTSGSSGIPDTNYPADKIAGVWVTVNPNKTGDPGKDDTKIYYEFMPNNRGKTRQFSTFKANGHSISLEANFSWEYLGSNRWRISLPGITGYKVIENHGVNVGGIKPRTMIARYHEDTLFVTGNALGFQVGMVWVRATRENILASLHRARTEPKQLLLGGQTEN